MSNKISSMVKSRTKPSFAEFVILMSMLMSLTALSIDAMLPALSQIGIDLNIAAPNDRQLVISMLFLGLSLGQLFFGPLSDTIGRKPAIYSGFIVFICGCLLSMVSVNFPMMLTGRLLQGVGISAPRAVTLALVRDQFKGRAMAQVMSFVMTVFILIPMFAPGMGQVILLFAGWRAIFGSFVLLSLIAFIWLALRQPETLLPENRAPFTWRRIVTAAQEVIKTRSAFGYTVAAGLISGAFIGYLNSSQQIFQEQYGLGTMFPLFFAVIASSVGLASLLNTRLVMRFGMKLLVNRSLFIISLMAAAAFGIALLTGGQPPLWILMVYLMSTFFCVGILFGNINSLAMEHLGHIAGIGAAIVGSLSTLISTLLGTLIGQCYNRTVFPLVAGLGILAGLSLFVINRSEKGISALSSSGTKK